MKDPRKEKRRLELNATVADNQRIKLGLSRKDWRRYKKFHQVYVKKIEALLTQYTADLVSYSVDPEGDVAVMLFDRYNFKWKMFIKPHINKLGLHDSKGRTKILAEFETQINKMIAKPKARAKAVVKPEAEPKINLVEEVVKIAKTYGFEVKSEYVGNNVKMNQFIMAVRADIPKGNKGKFEKEAKDFVKNNVQSGVI